MILCPDFEWENDIIYQTYECTVSLFWTKLLFVVIYFTESTYLFCINVNHRIANARLYQISIFKESSCISVILNDWCNDLLFQLQFSCNFGHLSRLSIFKLSQFVRIVWRETFLKQNIFHCARKWAMYLNRP